MKWHKRFIILALLVFVGTFSQQAQADGSKEKLADLIRTMGYGGAIHNFKNYVLRGTGKHQKRAQKQFAQVESLLVELRAD